MEQLSHDEQALIDKIRSLPADKAVEVKDFVDFLKSRETDRQLTQAAMKLSEQTFQRVWDNPDDAIYDQL